MNQKNPVAPAIKALRAHVGRTGPTQEKLSQEAFARQYLKVSTPTLQRWERWGSQVMPFEALLGLEALAIEHGCEDLSEAFRDGAIDKVPLKVRQWIVKDSTVRAIRKRA